MSTADLVKDLARQVEAEMKLRGNAQEALKRREEPVTVKHEGKQIILPEDMTKPEGIEWLKLMIAEDEMTVNVSEEIEAFPLEGAYALMNVLKETFGWVNSTPTPGFFGPKPPVLVSLEIAAGVFTQVVWGGFQIPGVEGQLQCGADRRDGRFLFTICGTIKKKSQDRVKKIAEQVRVWLKTNSVYKGKAIRIKTGDDGKILNDAPRFIETSKVNEDELIFSDEVLEQVRTSLFTPVERTAECRAFKVPLKRGVLLEGPYGTGKTLTAYVTAKKCEENGWTFIYLDKVGGLKDAILFAKQYAPAVIFSEDIDRAMDGERDVAMDDILNTIDGVESKGAEIITILTTNFIEKIDKAMLRPGRLDAIISVEPPDAKAVEKLIRLYARGLVDENENLSEAGEILKGEIPAVIREVVERAKLFAIGLSPDGVLKLNGKALAGAARGMKRHLSLMRPKQEVPLSEEQAVGTAIAKIVKKALPMVNGPLEKMAKEISEIHSNEGLS